MGVPMKALLTVSVMLTVCCALTLADKANCNKGVITPVDPYFLEGQDLVLTCMRHNRNPTRHLHFVYGYNRTMVDEKYVERNKTAVTLRIPNITADDVSSNSESTSYYCYDKRATKDVCIQNEYVEMDYYPKKAEDIKCIIDNWDSMTCTWDLAIQYKNPTNYDVSCQFVQNFSSEWDPDTVAELLYALSPTDERWATCPDGNKTSCHWKSSVFVDPKMYILKIKVTNTKLNITTYTYKTISTKDIVKPAPVNPSEIAVMYLDDPEHVHIQWNHSRILRNLLFNLMLVSDCDSPQVVELPYIPDLDLPEPIPAQESLTGLNPNTRYNFTLKAKGLEGSGPWSEPTEKHFTTLPAVPRSAPDTRNGLFEELQGKCDTTNCKEVQVYFKPLMKCEKISNTTKYLLSALKNETIESSKFSAVVNVPRNRSSTVQLRAVSQEGVSTNYSSQQVYPENEWPQVQRDLVIEYNTMTGVCNATIVILKEAINFVNISHTIVWCKGGAVCEQPIDWYTMAQNQTSTILPVSHCEHRYRVGITTSGRREATGEIIATDISWVHCKYEEGKVPKIPLPDAEIYNSSAYRFKITWTPYSCHTPDISYVENYHVSYCLVMGTENCTCINETETLVVSKLDNSHTVSFNKSVETGSKFCVWVRAKTMAGFGPRNTDNLFFTIGNNLVHGTGAHGQMVNIAVTVGTSVGAVIGAIVIIAVIISCYKLIKKRFEVLTINDIIVLENDNPHTAVDENRENVIETEPFLPEHDSGTSSITSNSSAADSQSNRDSKSSNDSGIHRIEMANARTMRSGRSGRNSLDLDDNPLSRLLEPNATSSGPYNGMPNELNMDMYCFDATNSSVGVISKTEKQEVDDEPIYDEIGSISSLSNDSLDKTKYMYLHAIAKSNVSSDQMLSKTDSNIVTEGENIPATGSLIHIEQPKDSSVSVKEQDRTLHSKSALGEKPPEDINESQGKDSDCTVIKVTEALQNSENKGTLTVEEETDIVSEFQSLPNQCGHRVPSDNQNLNFGDDALADGYKKPCDLLLSSQTGSNFSDFDNDDSCESLSNSGISDLTCTIEHSDSPTSHHIPHIMSQDIKLDLSIINSNIGSNIKSNSASVQGSNVDKANSKSNNESLNLIPKDFASKNRTPVSKAIQQKHTGRNKVTNGGTSGESYSKVTFSDS